ncbi:MAG: twin-arginine translocation pathway signal protein [Henriciella sp.]|nr:twin-arginine translocation pathway signal protein [Henriciella sp.]
MISRRAILTTAGASAVVLGAGAGGAAIYAHGPGLAKARAPWSEAGKSFGDPRIDALAYAILAPNPHNRQPWMFELIGDDQIDVHIDLDKRLPHTDPFDRQITIGFGCMLELLRMAAAEKGFRAEIIPFPDGEPQPRLSSSRIAQVTFLPDDRLARDPLFESVLTRRSTKEPYDRARPVDDTALGQVLSVGIGSATLDGTTDPDRVKDLINLAWLGWMIEYETDITRKESIDLMRIGNRQVVKNPDGIDMGGVQMGLFKMTGIVSHEGLNEKGSQAYNIGIDMYREIIDSAMGFAWIKADENTRLSQIDAGRNWVRVNLAAQQIGLCIHPLSQILQEFPEMREPYQAIHTKLGAEIGVVHMLGRLGYTKYPAASPRWPVESKLINS